MLEPTVEQKIQTAISGLSKAAKCNALLAELTTIICTLSDTKYQQACKHIITYVKKMIRLKKKEIIDVVNYPNSIAEVRTVLAAKLQDEKAALQADNTAELKAKDAD